MSLKELTARQKTTGDEIKWIAENYGKDSEYRKTLEYLTKRITSLNQLWDDFERVDTEIRTKHGSELSHAYFMNEYYEGIRSGYEKIKSEMVTRMQRLQEEEEARSSEIAQVTETQAQSTQKENDKTQPKPVKQVTETKAQSTQKENDKTQSKPVKQVTETVIGMMPQQLVLMQGLKRMLTNLEAREPLRSERFYMIKIKAIEDHWQQIQNLHNQSLNHWNNKDDVNNMEGYFDLEEQTHDMLIQLHECLSRCQSDIEADRNGSPLRTEHSARPMMKLPKVELPKFDGDYLKWKQFCDLFTELVHSQPIAACQKMWYLKGSLTGEAEKLVRHLSISEANYLSAWKVIKDRYENTRLLVTALLNKLLSQPAATTESAFAIRAIHDTTQECLLALENLDVNTSHWDALVLHILIKKLDKTTHTLWEQSLTQPRSLSTIKEFLDFLETRFQSLEALGEATKMENRRQHTQRALTTTVKTNCPSCNNDTDHPLFACQKFLQLSPSKRIALVKRINSCLNCLKKGHMMANCPSRGCTKCGKRHNTLLHISQLPTSSTLSKNNNIAATTAQSSRKSLVPPGNGTERSNSLSAKATANIRNYILLSTVMVRVSNNSGQSIECRAILDSGSQINLITVRLVKRLGLSGTFDRLNIEGIGSRRQQAQKRVNIGLESRINGFNTRLEAHILPRIISPQPAHMIDVSSWSIPSNIQLADPRFNQPDTIDLLIGAELYYSILSIGQIRLGDALPTLQNTVFGWTAAGKTPRIVTDQTTCGVCSEDETLNRQVEKFWILDDSEQSSRAFTSAEKQCETHFVQTTRRNEHSRFIVKLPFKNNPVELGESKNIAFQRLTTLERRLSTNPELKQQYVRFMEEYIELGHMKEENFTNIEEPYNFLPHHCVIKPESSTTKLRVVFDASAKTSTNISLNHVLATGPTIQDDVFSILLRFRMPRFVFTADIEKMYRQIRVHNEDRKYQLIWWRKNPTDQLKCYKLCTVTYGTTCAPYLATRCLQMLAEEQTQQYSLGAEVLKRDFYVDDVLTGADSLSTAIETQTQLRFILQSAGFKLRNWCANHPSLLKDIPQEDQEILLNFGSKEEDHIKTIGLTWLPKSDELCIKTVWCHKSKITKRTAYSDIAQLFDPLGMMAPVVVTAKVFLQRLWALKCDWDAALPQELHSYWFNFREGLKALNNVKIERHVFAHKNTKSVQIHIFADASEKAYGAVAYIRSIDKEHVIRVRLLCAKSRVAPIKQTTLPRLELCAAKLAAELGQRIKKDLNVKNAPMFLWSDSEIVLAWINSSSSSYQTFVANRVSVIQQLTIPEQWRHIGSKENPADILSRGIAPEKLGMCTLWFYGPTCLHGSEALWPPPYTRKGADNAIERRREKSVITSTVVREHTKLLEALNHRNSFRKAQRIAAYVLRFVRHARTRNIHRSHTLVLTAQELIDAQTLIIKLMQEEEFKEDLEHLQRFGEVSKNSYLSSLAPFIKDEIIRVGGRLEASNLSNQAKHPILLPHSHHLTKCLLNDIHKENLLVGPQTLLAISRQMFWTVKGKTLARSVVQHCVQCAKSKPKLLTQMMGNLPAHRVQPARPFVNCGVDFCGPIWTHFKTRGKKPQKSYIAVFCCFPTKATHLEVVSDLSTQGFLGALRRFMARRGHCKTIYCDNATNFVGARNQLQEVKEILESTTSQNKIGTACSSKGIDFRFIPPRSPHFGGLWEAAVKSAKHLLQRTLAAASLTYEELETAVIEIEAVLNSRPLTPMSSDPNDLTALTPGHFLIGEPLINTIDPAAEPTKSNLITRWKLVSHIKNEFWRRWTVEYLSQLQHRYKWKQRCENIELGTMVLIKEDNTPTLKWPLGRIINIIKGEDGLVRVADIRTSTGILRRPIHRLAPLPISTEGSDHSSVQDNGSTQGSERTSKTTASQHPEITNETPTNSNESDNSRTKANPRKKLRSSLRSAIVTLLLACLVVPPAKASSIEVKPFIHQPGIYFENLGVTNLISNEWNLVIFYDMMPYWREYQFLQNCTQTLEKMCQHINERVSCSIIIQHVKQLLAELTTNNMLLSDNNNSKRTKRGVANFVGSIANTLFGVLDSDYAERISRTIDDIHKNEDHLLQLIKNQTSIMDATLNVMKKEEEDIDNQFRQLQTQLSHVADQVNGIAEELYQEKLHQSFTALTMQTTLAASNFLRIQTSILDVLTDTHHGKISPLLISPIQLKEELTRIRAHLSPSLRLPISQDDALRYYTFMTIAGRVATRYLIFKLQIPLMSLEEFELFKITPFPVQINNSLVTIKPSSQFLVINLHRDQYYPLSEEELQSCIIIEDSKHICKQKHPIYKRGSTVSACEVSLINQLPQPPTCQLIKTGNGPHWIQLYSPNQWIYVLTERTTINVVCGDNTTQHSIQGAGILKITDRCLIKQPLVTIQGHSIYPSNSRASYIPSSNLTAFVYDIYDNKLSSGLHDTGHYQSHLAEIESIRNEVIQFKDNIPLTLTHHDVHQFAVGYGGILLTIIILLCMMWKCRDKVCGSRLKTKTPVAAPRQGGTRRVNADLECGTRRANTELEFNPRFNV